MLHSLASAYFGSSVAYIVFRIKRYNGFHVVILFVGLLSMALAICIVCVSTNKEATTSFRGILVLSRVEQYTGGYPIKKGPRELELQGAMGSSRGSYSFSTLHMVALPLTKHKRKLEGRVWT